MRGAAIHALLTVVDDTTTTDDTTSGSLQQGRARCADGFGTLTHLFFAESVYEIARAKAICARCTLRSACLAAALERGEHSGVWGGELVVEGSVVAFKRGRGRPPKRPVRLDLVDEVPVPPHLVA